MAVLFLSSLPNKNLYFECLFGKVKNWHFSLAEKEKSSEIVPVF